MNPISETRFSSPVLDWFKVVFYVVVCRRRPSRYLWWKALGFRIVGALGIYERKHMSFLSSVLPADGAFIDVGAHYGVYTRFLLRRAAEAGIVYAFEPHPEVFRSLERQFADRSNCRLFRVALSSQRRRDLSLQTPKLRGVVPEPALAYLAPSDDEASSKVEVAGLDDFASGMTRLDFIKVDVEGGELEFLAGATQTVGRHRPLILFECADLEAKYEAIEAYASGLSYRLCGLDERGRLKPVSPQDTLSSDANFYLVPAEHAVLRS